MANLIEDNAPAGRTLQVGITSTGLDIGSARRRQVKQLVDQRSRRRRDRQGTGYPRFQQQRLPLGRRSESRTDLDHFARRSLGRQRTQPALRLQITNGGATYTIDLSGCTTVEDVINAINGSGAGVKAQIDSTKTGLEVSSYTSGSDFTIGENGGYAATDLGLRIFNLSTPLANLNYGGGVGIFTGDAGSNITPYDFTITAPGGYQFNVSLVGCTTVGDVINKINDAKQRHGPGPTGFHRQRPRTGLRWPQLWQHHRHVERQEHGRRRSRPHPQRPADRIDLLDGNGLRVDQLGWDQQRSFPLCQAGRHGRQRLGQFRQRWPNKARKRRTTIPRPTC